MRYDLERVEALLRERSDGLTRAPARLLDPEAPPSERMLLGRGASLPPPEPRPAGTCASCDGPITAARLRAVPGAIRCIDCQLAFESGRPPRA